MKKELEYLTPDELEQLIAEVENTDMMAAPPDMMENVFEKLAAERRDKKKEYRSFCFRVWSSVAAALLIVFLIPQLGEMGQKEEFSLDPGYAVAQWEENMEENFFEKLSQKSSIFGRREKSELIKDSEQNDNSQNDRNDNGGL